MRFYDVRVEADDVFKFIYREVIFVVGLKVGEVSSLGGKLLLLLQNNKPELHHNEDVKC
jgi:hypothetical protein